MGYMRHNAIVVSGFRETIEKEIHPEAVKIFNSDWGLYENSETLVSPIVGSKTNGYSSFFIAPDGSKEGWETSDKADEKRNEFIEWLQNKDLCDWVEVQFGDEYHVTRIVRDSDAQYRS